MKTKLYDRISAILKEKGKIKMQNLWIDIIGTSPPPMEIIARIDGYITALIDLGVIGYEKIDGEIYVYLKGVNKDEI